MISWFLDLFTNKCWECGSRHLSGDWLWCPLCADYYAKFVDDAVKEFENEHEA